MTSKLKRNEMNFSPVRVTHEAGPGDFNLYDRLTVDGIDCHVTPPSLIPTQSGRAVNCSEPGGRSSIPAQMSYVRSRACC